MRRMILALLLAAAVSAAAQERPQVAALAPAQRAALRQFLVTSCSTGDTDRLQALIAAIPEAAFWEAYRLGPDAEETAKVRSAAVVAWRKRAEWLARADSRALSPDELAEQKRVSETAYVDRKTSDFRDRWRSAALVGVSLVGTPASIPELQRIAGDEKDPMSGAAKAALAALSSAKRP